MGDVTRSCFVMMPFAPELHYFYLFLKQYIEQNHNIHCERADAQVLTRPILDKINDLIQNSDIIIADCSKRNPNVFYELGIAHSHGKKVILITNDPVSEAPSDVKHYEFIHYELDKHIEFFEKLDNALHNVFIDEYKDLYGIARDILKEFMQETNVQVTSVTKEIFLIRVMAAERTQDIPSFDDVEAIKEFVLPRIITDSNDITIMSQIIEWLYQK